jgi:hypothetical protein
MKKTFKASFFLNTKVLYTSMLRLPNDEKHNSRRGIKGDFFTKYYNKTTC